MGEIVDETDVAEEPILRVSRSEVIAVGDVDLREINHFFNTAFPQLEHRSLNGYLLEELGRVPGAGDVFDRDGVVIEVLEATEAQVMRAGLAGWLRPGSGGGGGSGRPGRRQTPGQPVAYPLPEDGVAGEAGASDAASAPSPRAPDASS